MIFTFGCGGGGGGGGEVPPSNSSFHYTGLTDQALLTETNVLAMSLGSYSGTNTGMINLNDSSAPSSISIQVSDEPLRPQFLSVVQDSVVSVDLLGSSQDASIQTQATRSNTVTGPCGGSLSIAINVNETTGEFTGSYTFSNYCDSNITTSGSGDLTGIINTQTYQLESYRMTFDLMTVNEPERSYEISGWLDFQSNSDGSRDARMDLLMHDLANGNVYWLEDCKAFYSRTGDVEMSGRYYEPTWGYVDFVTEVPLGSQEAYLWPSQGVMVITGRDGTTARMTFYATGFCRLEADFNADQEYEWDYDHWFTSSAGMNRAPFADAGPDRTLILDTQIVLSSHASHDPDNDPLTCRWNVVSYPPGGFPHDVIINQPTLEFTPSLLGRYVIELTVNDGQLNSPPDRVVIDMVASAPADPNLLGIEWKYGTFGNLIGDAGMNARDIDGDGALEIVTAAAGPYSNYNNFWYVAKRTASGEYVQVWSSRLYDSAIQRILTVDTDNDGVYEVYVGLVTGTVNIYNGRTYAEIDTLTTGDTFLYTLEIGDTDGDGAMEIVVSGRDEISEQVKLSAFAADSRQPLWSTTAWGGGSIAIGNVDSDASPEIVTTDNYRHGYVINGANRNLEWEFIDGFGQMVQTGDIDNDGIEEIIGAAQRYQISVFDAVAHTQVGEISADSFIGGLLVADADGDQIPEILFADEYGGKIHCHDGDTLAHRWAFDKTDRGTGHIALGDVDDDGGLELIWGGSNNSPDPMFLNVADVATGANKWTSDHIDGPMSAVDVGDVDDDGRDEIVMVSYKSGSSCCSGAIHIFDASSHVLEWTSDVLPGINKWSSVHSIKIGDVDGDGDTEFVIETADAEKGVIQIYNGSTKEIERTTQGYDLVRFTKMAFGDVDNDGQMEMVAGQSTTTSDAIGPRIIVFDGATAQEEWRSVTLSEGYAAINDIALADTDADGNVEIFASVNGQMIYACDGVTHVKEWDEAVPAYAIVVKDFDADGQLELLLGCTNGEIQIYDGSNFNLEDTLLPIAPQSIMALMVADLDIDGASELLAAGDRGLMIFNSVGDKLLWSTGNIGGHLGRYNQMVCRDTNGDGRNEVFVGSDVALYQFE